MQNRNIDKDRRRTGVHLSIRSARGLSRGAVQLPAIIRHTRSSNNPSA